MMDKEKDFKKDFPILNKKIRGKNLVFLDNASTTQKPSVVIGEVKDFYENENSNIHRSAYFLSEISTEKYESCRKKTASFINADDNEIIFTSGTTESINLLSFCVDELFQGRDEIVLTEMEHHANLIPWQELAKRKNLKLKFIKVKEDLTLDYDQAKELINEKTALVSFTWISNSLGTINDVEKFISFSKTKKVP
jgi:cysteine desulfurase/selenocysteine lyase